jgi:hypothetical protein
MATHDYNISNQTFPATRTDINNVLEAIVSKNSSGTAPATTYAYMWWYDTATTTLKIRNRDDDAWISFASFDQDNDTVNFLDSEVSIAGVTTSATGTVLTLTDSTVTSSVDFIIDNQKEIRFREQTGNGTNYVALKAPASLTTDTTFILPSADGTANQILKTDGSGNLSFVDSFSGIAWQSVQTTGFTAVKGNAYPCDTTSAGFTVTLPATPSAGDQVQLVDYAGTFDTNALTINGNGEDIEGVALNFQLTGEREGVILTYIDSTQGWIATSGINEGTDALSPAPYSVDFLVVAGGGSGGGDAGGGGGAGGYRTSTQTVSQATVITVTVGDGGAGVGRFTQGITGSNSSISGTGLTTITSAGGGGGGAEGASGQNGLNGGSGGGGGSLSSPANTSTGGTGNTPNTSPSQGNNGGTGTTDALTFRTGGGGGGANAVGVNGSSLTGGNGGAGTASSITGSSVTRAGGGGGANGGTGGAGGGGASGGNAGTVNTGGGGGGGTYTVGGGAGGKGVVILSMPDGNYSGTTTGSPTVATGVSGKTVLTFNGTGSYTA